MTCCVKKKALEVCAQCPEFPCSKFKTEEEYRQLKESSSYPSYRKLMPNQRFIREHGIEEFLHQQGQRMTLLEAMLADYDDGRSKSFFCRAAVLLEIRILRSSLDEASARIRSERIKKGDRKQKAQMLKGILGHSFGDLQ
jgi:hypothetical protein